MFERFINEVIQEEIDRAVAHPNILNIIFSQSPSVTAAEAQTMREFFLSSDGTPSIIHNYARKGGTFPCFTIVLLGEKLMQSYLADEAPLYVDEVAEFGEQLAEALGEGVVDVGVQRWEFNYNIGVYAENPDVVVAYYTFLRNLFMGSEMRLLEEGMEEPTFSGADLEPDPRYMPDNLFARQFQISCFAHMFHYEIPDLGPLGWGRGKSVRGIHIEDHVTDVVGLVETIRGTDG